MLILAWWVSWTRQLAGPGVEDPLAAVMTTFDTDENVANALRAQ